MSEQVTVSTDVAGVQRVHRIQEDIDETWVARDDEGHLLRSGPDRQGVIDQCREDYAYLPVWQDKFGTSLDNGPVKLPFSVEKVITKTITKTLVTTYPAESVGSAIEAAG